jgi:alkanesulfonate monooxygenase SsuD/methylene tetrahydromethanopterin reductase-like flavin-dependent oxidoreductase (luciferase family)
VASPEALIAVAQAADELGFYGVSVQDHIIADAALSSCGDLHDCSGDDRTVYEALHTLAFVAARTEGVKLVTGILVVPFRHAVLLAKETAALDLFSGGRLVVGVGVGAPRRGRIGSGGAQNISVHARVADKEFSAFKVEGHRGKITDETLQVMDAIWTQGSATFHGKYYDFEELEVYPKPLQQPRPRLWIGGRSEAAQDRAVLLADGWIPSQISVPMFADGVTHMRALATEQGRPMPQDLGVNVFVALGDSDRQAREFLVQGFGSRFNDEGLETLVIYGTPETFAKKLQRFVDAGVNVFDLKLVPITVDATLEAMCLLAAEVFPAVSR